MRLLPLGFLAAAALVLTVACGAKPKQAEVPDVTKDQGADMAGEEAAVAPKSSSAPAAESEVEMHKKCCEQCKAGAAKDRSGQPASAIPCTDFTADLNPWCLEHFRGKPTMAADCR